MKPKFICLVILIVSLIQFCAGAAQRMVDGDYSMEVQLFGGSGRARVSSPTLVRISKGELVAVIEWSSPYYEYMKLDGKTYMPVQTEGNAKFEIPIVLDERIVVSAQTIAMSQAYEVEYKLYFDSSTAKQIGGTPVPWTKYIGIAVGYIALLAMFFILKRRLKKQVG